MERILLFLLSYLVTLLPWQASVVEPPVPPPAQEAQFSTVSSEGEYEIAVRGNAIIGPGPAYMPWQFNLLKEEGTGQGYYDSVFLADVQPVTEEMASFQEDFESAGAYIAEKARQMYGNFLRECSFETVESPGQPPIYVMRLRLDDGEHPMEFSATWRFEQSYVASYLGVNLGDRPDMDAVVLEAAADFQDNTAAPRSANPMWFSTYQTDPWDLPVQNILAVIDEYAVRYRSFRKESNKEEAAIVWQHDYMEALARKVAEKPEGPIYPSDLAHITRIAFEADMLRPDQYTMAAYGPYEHLDIDDASHGFVAAEPVRDLDGLEYFRGVQMLTLSLPGVTDVAALASLDRVEHAMLSFSPELTDLSPMGGMRALQYLMMWGYDCAGVEDISFFVSLTDLETVFFIDSSISDAGVFAQLPALTKLYFNAAATLDKQPLIDCAHIEELMLNGESIR